MQKIYLPQRPNNRELEHVAFSEKLKTLVIIGANGSGKTRLGSYIEEHFKNGMPALGNRSQIHRISAQKTLSMPTFTSTVNKAQAKSDFLYGGWDDHDHDHFYETKGWKNYRW